MAVPLEVFCCYAREDQEMLEHLKKHLIPLQRNGQITLWSDTNLRAGAEWEKELHQHLESADIILLLISPDFMASDYCYSTEMGRAIERHKQGGAQVIPLLLRPVHWDDAPFAQLQIIPTNAEPVTKWLNRDDAFHDTVKHVSRVITSIKIQRALLEAGEYESAIHYQEALVCYERVLLLDQANGPALFGKARTLFLVGEIDTSIETFALAEQIAPTAGENFFSQLFKARAFSQREYYAESLTAYDQVLRLEPNNAAIYAEKATILIEQKAYEQALSTFGQACQLEPQKVEYSLLTGNLLFRLQRFKQALTMYEQAAKLEPDQASHYEWQGKTLLQLQRHEDALVVYRQALALAPQAQYYEQTGKICLRLGRYQEALDLYEQALTTINDNSYLYASKGQALIHLERYSEALACFESAIKLSEPEADPQFYHDQGTLHELLARHAYDQEQQRRLMWQPEIGYEIFPLPVFDPIKLTLLQTLNGHLKEVCSIAISPDGKTLASASRDKTIKLWELPSGRELCTLTGHTGALYAIAISPNGKILASGGSSSYIKLWELPSGRELNTFSYHGVKSMAISPTGKILASASNDKTIKLWELPSGRELKTLSGHTSDVDSVAFSPDGKILASASNDKTIKLWELPSGRELKTLSDYTYDVDSVAFSPDGKILASGASDGIKLWRLPSVRKFSTFTGYGYTIAFSLDGKTLASASLSNNEIKLWELPSGRELKTLSGHMGGVNSVAFSPDGKILASGGEDHTIKLWGMKP